MKPAWRKLRILTCIGRLNKYAKNHVIDKEIEVTGYEVTQIQINRSA